MAQLMFRIANESPPNILTINAALPVTLVSFLEKAMQKDADQRFQTGEEFATGLRAALGGGGGSAPPADLDISL